MGGVAAVAAGRGAPLAAAYDDRPDAIVPATGPLRAEDLRRVRFSLAFRGYRMGEVDALLDRLARQEEEREQRAGRAAGRTDAAWTGRARDRSGPRHASGLTGSAPCRPR